MSYIGTNKVGKMYLGSTAIGKAYLGSSLVYEGAPQVPLEVTITNNVYVGTNGVTNANASGFFYTTTVPVKQGQVVKFSCYGGAAQSVIFTMANGTRTNRVTGSGSSTYKTYTWTATSDAEVGFSAKRGTTAPVATVGGRNVTINGY